MPCPTDPSQRPGLQSIQALRAAAALAVVAYHAMALLGAPQTSVDRTAWANGAAGVDVFFVISGFVMVRAASRWAGQTRAGWQFFRARLHRIVPLYWLCTVAKWMFAPHAHAGPGYAVASLLFLPVHDDAGRFKPVVSVGWTLSFEMMFYALFAAALALRVAPAFWVPPVLAAISLMPHDSFSVAAEMCNPIGLEFAYGTSLGLLSSHRRLLPVRLAWPVLFASIAVLLVVPKSFVLGRFVSWGLPAAGLVAAAVALENSVGRHLPRAVTALGDASYAIYLTHGFVLAGLASGLAYLQPIPSVTMISVLLGMAASAGFGWLIHVAIEKPLLGIGMPAGAGQPVVAVLAGGGLSAASGGVGILLRNLMEVWANSPDAPCTKLIDTRGGGGAIAAASRFALAFCQLVGLGMMGRVRLVHAHMTTRGSAVRKTVLCGAAMCLRIPVIVHMHGADFMPFYKGLSPVFRFALRAMLKRARHVVVLGTAWRLFMICEVGISPDRVSIVANGVPNPAAALAARLAAPHILFLGRLCARKGVPELIAALASPELRALPWQATLAGDGDPEAFRALLGWYRLAERIKMPGWVGRQEIAALLAGADMLVLPSYHEAMPLAVLEALAAGVPVIATPVGTLPEFLVDGVNALLVPPGSVAQLADALARLLRSPALRERLAAGGRKTFRAQLEIGGVAARMAALYREVMQTPTRIGSGAGSRVGDPKPQAAK